MQEEGQLVLVARTWLSFRQLCVPRLGASASRVPTDRVADFHVPETSHVAIQQTPRKLQEAAAAAAAAAGGRLGAHVQSLGASAGPPHPLEGTLRALRYPDWQLQPQAPQPPRVRA